MIGIVRIAPEGAVEMAAGGGKVMRVEGERATGAVESGHVRRQLGRTEKIRLGGDGVAVFRVELAAFQVESRIGRGGGNRGVQARECGFDLRMRTRRRRREDEESGGGKGEAGHALS